MNNSTIKNRDTGTNRSQTRKVGIKKRLKIIATSALLLAATNATAGITSLPGSVTYTAPELALMTVSKCPGDFNVAGCVRIHTTGLTGELSINGGAIGSQSDLATAAKAVLPFEQELDLIIDLTEGTVSGHANHDSSSPYIGKAKVRGYATCLPFNGRECGQLVMDLELQGALVEANNSPMVGSLRIDMLSSFIFDGSDVGFWAAMSANTTIGGNEELINSVLRYAACNGALVIC